jgi:hypothetical protein
MTETARPEEQDGTLRRAAPAGAEDEQVKGTARVVLRGVQVIVLDDLTPDKRRDILGLSGVGSDAAPRVQEAWVAVAARTGTPESVVASYAGSSGEPDCKPGKYKAPPAGAWFVRAQHVEPPLS